MWANLSNIIFFFLENNKCFALRNKASIVKNPFAIAYIWLTDIFGTLFSDVQPTKSCQQ